MKNACGDWGEWEEGAIDQVSLKATQLCQPRCLCRPFPSCACPAFGMLSPENPQDPCSDHIPLPALASSASARLGACPGFGIQCWETALDPTERWDPPQSLPWVQLPPSQFPAPLLAL